MSTKRRSTISGNKPSITRIAEVLVYNPNAGIFTFLPKKPETWENRRWNTRYAGREAGFIAGNPGKQYRRICVDAYRMPASHAAWALMTGEWPVNEIDHINRNGTDDRWNNLRPATSAENSRNRGLRSDSKTGVKGVRYVPAKRCWRSRITLPGGKRIELGSFKTTAEAAAAYREAAARFHGDFGK